MREISAKELLEIIEEHKLWLNNDGGQRADLRDADLKDANLKDADLSNADLRGADLRDADLRGANLRGANLRGANLRGANLRGADLRGANLRGANLDFSCMPLWCGDLTANYDEKQIIQQLYHVLSHVQNSDNISEEFKNKMLKQEYLEIANKFHRVDECGEIKC